MFMSNAYCANKNSNNDNGMKYLLVTLNCLSIAVTSAVQHVLHFEFVITHS